MASSNLSNMLMDNWDVVFKDFGVSVQTLANKEGVWHVDAPYFFLRKELGVSPKKWKEAKTNGEIRHCILNKDKFFDYVVNKKFDTFEDWLTDAGGVMEDVLYGENRIHRKVGEGWNHALQKFTFVPDTARYVELDVLTAFLGLTEHFETELDEDGIPMRVTREVLDDWEEAAPRVGSSVIHPTT
jgi:hypothetical protein